MKWMLLNTTALCRSPADEAGGGGEGGEGGEGGDSGGTGGEGGDAGGEGGDDSGRQQSTLLDFASKGGEGGEGGDWTPPEGMDLPDHLKGTSADATLEKLHKAYKGLRQELSTRPKEAGALDGAVPDSIEGYTFDAIEADPKDDAVLADLTSEDSKQYMDPAREVAKELGIPDATFAKFMHGYVSKLTEQGLNLSMDPEEAQRVSGEAEMAELTKALGPQGADLALKQIDTFAQKLAQNGILQDQKDVQEFAQMVGTAEGLQIMQRIIVAEFGEQAIPPADMIDGAPTLEEAYANHREALSMQPGADRQDAIEAAERAIEKAMQQSSTTGQVRSRVL